MSNRHLLPKIITFYSFKGGVGRSMALANVGFLAALNGKKVLLLDWDLEAPGLEYYFRGLSNRDAGDVDMPGILNLLVNWKCQVRDDVSAQDLDRISSAFKDGHEFRSCVQALVEPSVRNEVFPPSAALDFISAGSRHIDSVRSTYEDALTNFSWKDFFDQHAGGFFLQCLRDWAKNNYDLILIDSRTGLADAAGVCTLLLPDTVALCFALNHQNIEGVARVASSIRATSENSISVRPIAMRVARRDSSESSDAQARAISALTQTAGLDSDATKKDLQNLFIAFDENVPFYETLAPFIAPDPSIDPLCVSYLRLARSLFDEKITMPRISDRVYARVKERLSPRAATAQYVLELQGADPDRAFGELRRLVDSAVLSAKESEFIDRDYVAALFAVSLDLVHRVDEVDLGFSLLQRATEILRILVERDRDTWTPLYVSSVDEVVGLLSIYDRPAEEIALRTNMDRILSGSAAMADKLARLRNLLSLCQALLQVGRVNEVPPLLEQLRIIAEPIELAKLGAEQEDAFRFMIARVAELYSDVARQKERFDESRAHLETGLVKLGEVRGADFEPGIQSSKFRFHYKLATLPQLEPAVQWEHIIAAAGMAPPEFTYRFMDLAKVVVGLPADSGYLAQFLILALGKDKRRRIIAQASRNSARAVELLQLLRQFFINLPDAADELTSEAVDTIIVSFIECVKAIGKGRFKDAPNTIRAVKIATDFAAQAESRDLRDRTLIDSLQTAVLELRQSVSSDLL